MLLLLVPFGARNNLSELPFLPMISQMPSWISFSTYSASSSWRHLRSNPKKDLLYMIPLRRQNLADGIVYGELGACQLVAFHLGGASWYRPSTSSLILLYTQVWRPQYLDLERTLVEQFCLQWNQKQKRGWPERRRNLKSLIFIKIIFPSSR